VENEEKQVSAVPEAIKPAETELSEKELEKASGGANTPVVSQTVFPGKTGGSTGGTGGGIEINWGDFKVENP